MDPYKLGPCKLCHTKPLIDMAEDGGRARIFCPKCGYRISRPLDEFWDLEPAVREWNAWLNANQSTEERLAECKSELENVIEQVLFVPETAIDIDLITRDIPDELTACEQKLIAIVKQQLDIRKQPSWGKDSKPYYSAGWLSAYESAFYYLTDNGLAKFVYPDWDQMIYFPDEYPEGGEVADTH